MEIDCTKSSLVFILILLLAAVLVGAASTLGIQAFRRDKRQARQFAAVMKLTPHFTVETAAALMASRPKTVSELIGRRLTTGELTRNQDGSFSVTKSTGQS